MIDVNKNNLIDDPSPYLRQHKNNPVHWQTWSKNTLEEAKKNSKPILLSIGYASCHWCHGLMMPSAHVKEIARRSADSKTQWPKRVRTA